MKIIAAIALVAAASISAVLWWRFTPESISSGTPQVQVPPGPKDNDKDKTPIKSPGDTAKPDDKTKIEATAVAQVKTDPETKDVAGEFKFPDDLVGQRLAKSLPPELASIKPKERKPLVLHGPAWLEKPELPPPAFVGGPIRPALPPRSPARPANPREDLPIVKETTPSLPEKLVLPEGPLARQNGQEVDGPLPLPILAQPDRDRVSLADPSQEASLAAALTAAIPPRTTPVPFTPMNLPNPFEYHGPASLRSPPPEEMPPPLVLPHTPGR